MFNFRRFLKTIDLKVKVFGMGHGVAPVTATVTLSHVQDMLTLTRTQTSKTSGKAKFSSAVRCALKRDYFDAFLSIHSYLDSFNNY